MNNPTFPSMGAILEADEYGMIATALKTALELDVFEIVARGARRVEEIAASRLIPPVMVALPPPDTRA